MKPGDLIDDRYELIRAIGDGGMGAVFEAINTRIKKRVAIKVLHLHSHDEEMMKRFEQEARAAARVGSSHIVDVVDLGDLPDGRNFIVMEYLEGESLADRLEREPKMEPRDVALLAVQLLAGLAMVHAEGVVHRDLKPANVFLVPANGTDFVKILDFGVCKIVGDKSASVTQPGSVLGTPSYMAPEQIETGEIDGRADLYAVAVMMYRAVVGQTPFRGATLHQLIAKITDGKGEPLSAAAPEVDEGFAAIIEKAMQKRPDDRYPDATSFRADLIAWLEKSKRVDRLLADFLGTPDEAFDPVVPIAPPRASSKQKEAPPKEHETQKEEPIVRIERTLREPSKRVDLHALDDDAPSPEEEMEEAAQSERVARLTAATEAAPEEHPRGGDATFERAETLRYSPDKRKRLLLFGGAGVGSVIAIGVLAVALRGERPLPERARHERSVAVESIAGTARPRAARAPDEHPPDEPKRRIRRRP